MMKNLKIIISLAILTFIFSFNVVLADSCDGLKPILDSFYKSSQEENMEAYLEVMDVDYLRENLVDNYEDYVKSAWEVHDTKDYKLAMYNCRMEENDALAYFNLSTTLLSGDQEVETQRNYIALFSKPDSWKIRYVMDEDDFSQFQSSLYTQLFLEATEDEMTKAYDDAETVLRFAKIEEELLASDYKDTVSEGVERKEVKEKINYNYKEKRSGRTIFLILFFLGPVIIFVFVKEKK